MKEVDDDFADAGKETIETLRRGVLAEGFFENRAEEIGNRAQVGGIGPNSVEGATCEIEFIAETHVDIRYLILRRLSSRPLRQRFEQLFCGDEEMRDALFNLRDLFLRLWTKEHRVISDVIRQLQRFEVEVLGLTTTDLDGDRPEPEELRGADETELMAESTLLPEPEEKY